MPRAKLVISKGSMSGAPAHDIQLVAGDGAMRFMSRVGLPKPGGKPAIWFTSKDGLADLSGSEDNADVEPYKNGLRLTTPDGQFYLTDAPDGNTLIMNVSPAPEKLAGFGEYLAVEASRAFGFIPPAPATPGFNVPTPPEPPSDGLMSAIAAMAKTFLTSATAGAGAAVGWGGVNAFKDKLMKGAADADQEVSQISPAVEAPDSEFDKPAFGARRHSIVGEANMGQLHTD